MTVIEIPSASSTNSWVAENSATLPAPCLVRAVEQTCGRGQRGNSWEAEPGMNITASALFTPRGIAAAEQFVISEAVALAVTDMLGIYDVEAHVKWPNDIYVGDRKICGILIEHSILGSGITRTIAGIGVNINQTRFLSDAPNPVSLSMLTGAAHDLTETTAALAAALDMRMVSAQASGLEREKIHSEFMSRLWRGDGRAYPFLDRRSGERIEAAIAGVASDGILSLALAGGETRTYAFKEVEFLINENQR